MNAELASFVGRGRYDVVHRLLGVGTAGELVEQFGAEGWVGDVLRARHPDAVARPHAPGRDGWARRGDHRGEHAGAGTPACEGERHGITAVTVTSTTHSGRASESMTSPVEA